MKNFARKAKAGDITECALNELRTTFYKECALCAARGQGLFCLICGTEFNLVNERVDHEGLDHTLLEGLIPLRFTCPWVKVMTVDGLLFDLEIRTDIQREAP